MKLHELLRSCFSDPEDCRIFLVDVYENAGRDVWDSTDGPWTQRAFEVAEKLAEHGLKDRQLFEALLNARPKRADDIAAACRAETGLPLNYVVDPPPPAEVFPWSTYRSAMSPGLVHMLRLAGYDARTRGYPTISTSEIFRVYRALQPWIAAPFPDTDIDPSDLDGEADPFDDELGASFCVSKTIHGLAGHLEPPALITEHDVFLDLARFGAGESARKLASDGDSMDRINRLSRQLAIGRITRHGPLETSDAAGPQ